MASPTTRARPWWKHAAVAVLGERRKKQLLYGRAQVWERCGSRRYSWPGWNGLDRRLVDELGHRRGGTFIEAGANDGYAQSNTYYLERFLGWQGLLIEPVPALAALCRQFRPLSDVREVALCDLASDGSSLRLEVEDLRTSVQRDGTAGSRHTITVPAQSLTSLALEVGVPHVDLLSLDVEGYELQALAGLDRDRVCPTHILVETADPNAVGRALSDTHMLRRQLSHHDYLFSVR